MITAMKKLRNAAIKSCLPPRRQHGAPTAGERSLLLLLHLLLLLVRLPMLSATAASAYPVPAYAADVLVPAAAVPAAARVELE
jgi:hypothetical protein